jgi:hypothetical protein
VYAESTFFSAFRGKQVQVHPVGSNKLNKIPYLGHPVAASQLTDCGEPEETVTFIGFLQFGKLGSDT